MHLFVNCVLLSVTSTDVKDRDQRVLSAPDRKNGNLNILAAFLDDMCRYFGQGLEDMWSIFGMFLEGILRGLNG